MKGIALITLAAFIILLLPYNAHGGNSSSQYICSPYLLTDYIAYEEHNDVSTADNALEEPESRLRRFEITFFISLPFVFIATYLTLNLYGVLSDPNDLNVDVWGDYKNLLLGGTALITTGIAMREAIVWRDRKPEERAAKPHERSLFLSLSRRY